MKSVQKGGDARWCGGVAGLRGSRAECRAQPDHVPGSIGARWSLRLVVEFSLRSHHNPEKEL